MALKIELGLHLPKRVLTQLEYHDRWFPGWFNLTDHTVTRADLVRIRDSGIAARTPMWGVKVLEWFKMEL